LITGLGDSLRMPGEGEDTGEEGAAEKEQEEEEEEEGNDDDNANDEEDDSEHGFDESEHERCAEGEDK